MDNNSGTPQFNHVTDNIPGSNVVTIRYINGDAVRYALLSVNGGAGMPVSFPSTGSFQTVGSIERTVTLNAGSDNTLEFYNPIAGSWAPDFDRIGVDCHIPPPTDFSPQDGNFQDFSKKVLTQFRVSRQKGVLPMMCVPVHET